MPQNIAENPSYDSSILVPASVVHSITPLIAKRPSAGASTATTVTNALTQRLAALQEENDELYTLLKRGTVGRLQEEVTELRTLSRKLEKALKGMRYVPHALSLPCRPRTSASSSPPWSFFYLTA